jgi:phosphoribosylformylglycinamidine synthase subunit PurSL
MQEHTLVIGRTEAGARSAELAARARQLGIPVDRVDELRVVHLRGDLSDDALDQLADRLLADPIGQWTRRHRDHHADAAVVETGLRPGVTDREAAELVRAAGELGARVEAAALGRRFVVHGELTDDDLHRLASRVLHNGVIERYHLGPLAAAHTDPAAVAPPTVVEAIRGVDDDGLVELGRRRRLGLDLDELRVIRHHFTDLGRDPTDAELETLAQTWSEHCSHKTFRGLIQTPDGEVDGLLRCYLRAATDAIAAPWVRSAFVDNAGIIAFDDTLDLAIKAETHNHPSALEPFGGANTGVGGVVRDILGVSAQPIAITDILCFGPDDLDPASVPEGVLHPRRVRDGVIAGVGDYGNKLGVPTVAGAIVHDPAYTTTPLVFAGCLGVLPTGSHRTTPGPGDAIVMLGGAVGRDGVGGATFSSQTMGVETAEVAGSSVQIGDPVVEKGLIDVVVRARDAGLYSAITDCGAGGLSSAVGEMAASLGARVDLDLVPRKYAGLAPWEVWLSEAQERMVLATPDPGPLLGLAARWQVGATVIGHFTGDGRLVVVAGEEPVVDLDTGFLHDGRPRRTLRAAALDTARPARRRVPVDPAETLLRLLAHPSIRSTEHVVRTYDHEVLGGTLVRPFGGVAGDGPADGTVVVPPGTDGRRGAAIGIGVNALLGDLDAYAMAWHVIDEAIRNAVVAGADPDHLALLDNFSWGDPTDADTLARLVEAVRGCHDAAIAHRAPFVSGKDSLYNVFVHPDGTRDPVAPTLVITALGIVPDTACVPLTGVVEPGDDVWLVGPAEGALGGSHLDAVLGEDHGGSVPAPEPEAAKRHRQLHAAIRDGLVRSAHDLSEGGLAVAAAEWALGGRLGVELDVPDGDPVGVLFGEAAGRYLVEVRPEALATFATVVPDARRIGTVVTEPSVRIRVRGELLVDQPLDRLVRAFTGGRW